MGGKLAFWLTTAKNLRCLKVMSHSKFCSKLCFWTVPFFMSSNNYSQTFTLLIPLSVVKMINTDGAAWLHEFLNHESWNATVLLLPTLREIVPLIRHNLVVYKHILVSCFLFGLFLCHFKLYLALSFSTSSGLRSHTFW